MVSVLKFNLFRRKNGKWHEVRWRSGARHIFLALRFAPDGTGPSAAAPTIEKLPQPRAENGTPESGTPENGAPHPSQSAHAEADEALIIREVQAAVAEYNRMNLCALRVAGIRYLAVGGADPRDHGTATRKLLNLL